VPAFSGIVWVCVYQGSFQYTMLELENYTRLGVGGDSRKRYDEYTSFLLKTLKELDHAGITRVIDLIDKINSKEKFEALVIQSGIHVKDIAIVLKYLVYCFVPMKKYLSGLVRNDPQAGAVLKKLGDVGIRTNLDLLQQGTTPTGRQALAEASGLPVEVILEWVNRADLSHISWAGKATISNIMGAGCGSVTRLANADPEQLSSDFFAYGKAIGKNLKLGNEIESSRRMAKILPILVQEG
jgi:hypothetical protein